MFLTFTAVSYGNEFICSSNYDTPRQAEGDFGAKAKINACFSQAFMRGIGGFMQWSINNEIMLEMGNNS